jgi:serine acetyltransferase
MTFFNDLKVGDKFKLPGGSVVFRKVNGHTAAVGSKDRILVNPLTEVVPEHNATADDILNSWRKL